MDKSNSKIITVNRKAHHDYFVEQTFEAGISLSGTEVKSIRAGNVNLKDSFCVVEKGEAKLIGVHISPYEKGNIFNKDPLRKRRLLLHKKEILKLQSLVMRDGYSLIPLSMYFKNSFVKIELGVCKGKKLYDKRESEAAKSARRDMDRQLKSGTKGE